MRTLIEENERLRDEIRRRPKSVKVMTRGVSRGNCFRLDEVKDIYQKEPEYTEVRIETNDAVYEFLSPTFTRTPTESLEVEVYALPTGEVKFHKRNDRYIKTTLPERYKTDWVTWEKVNHSATDIWFWWNGEASFPVNIMRDVDGRFFACVGQWGWTVAQFLEDMGGLWHPCICPKPPEA